MTVAIPVSGGWIAPVFDSATRLLVVDVGPTGYSEQYELPSFVRPLDQRAAELDSLGVELLLCDRISDSLARFVRERGIEIRSSIFRAVDEVVSSVTEIARAVVLQPTPEP